MGAGAARDVCVRLRGAVLSVRSIEVHYWHPVPGTWERWPRAIAEWMRQRPAIYMRAANDGDGGPGSTHYVMGVRPRPTRAQKRERMRELLDGMGDQLREGNEDAHYHPDWECPF